MRPVHVYAVHMGEQSAALKQVERWLSLVPPDRAERIARFRNWQDRWRSLAGDRLVRYVLREQYRIPEERNVHRRDAYGKPALIGQDAQYNVSHSGDWVTAAFHATEPVGIDIERIGEADLQLAEAMFARSEYEALCKKSIDDRARFFYAIWTGKESYIKARGLGLSIPLDSFCVASAVQSEGGLREAVVACSDTSGRMWNLHRIELDPDYSLTVCTGKNVWPLIINVINHVS
jgi:4'-phosphopantetheinyl transferase